MIPRELEAEVLRLSQVEGWPPGTIASQLALHHDVVDRVLAQGGTPQAQRAARSSILDPFRAFIAEQLKTYPRLASSRLFHMARERGYPGGPDHFRHCVAQLRPPRPAEAYLRLRTLPGEQAQVDWAHFGKLAIGRATRPLVAFVMVLSWSRMLFLRFFFNLRLASFLRGHVEAFEFFGRVPRVCLYDNLKSAVLERKGDAVRFNPTLLDLSTHYRYQPKPVAPYRGNEKGRVERAVRYVRGAFFAARAFRNLADLNAQARTWCLGEAADRPCPEDRAMSVRDAFAQEQPRLLPLPDHPFPADERLEVRAGKTPYVRFDLNDYSVPHTLARATLTVVANQDTVRVLAGDDIVATHPRSYDRGAQIEDPAHLAGLVAQKREARRHRGLDRLRLAVPQTADLLVQLAERGQNLGSATAALLRLLDQYGAEALKRAAAEALLHQVPHPSSVRHILDRETRKRGLPPPVPVHLPDDPRVRDLSVRPHDLNQYDTLKEEPVHEPENP